MEFTKEEIAVIWESVRKMDFRDPGIVNIQSQLLMKLGMIMNAKPTPSSEAKNEEKHNKS